MELDRKFFCILPDQTEISPTEIRNPNSMNLSNNDVNEILNLFLDDTMQAFTTLNLYLDVIEKLIHDVIECFKKDGKLYYVGAGTSGRLALMDALECPPTFGCTSQKIKAFLAGGSKSFEQEQGFAEDCISDGVSASGLTPFVWGSLYATYKKKIKTGLLTFNPFIVSKFELNHLIKINCGPEILTGSTRLKCGNLTKVILNMISTTAMIKIGYCVSNLMINVQPTNTKLKQRVVNILLALLEEKNVDENYAILLLEKNNYDIKKVLKYFDK